MMPHETMHVLCCYLHFFITPWLHLTWTYLL